MKRIALAGALILSACSAEPPIHFPKSEVLDPSDIAAEDFHVDLSLPLVQQAYSIPNKEVCIKQEGKWQPLGRQQKMACVLSTSDAGKPCANSSECEVACIVDNEKFEQGAKARGVCSASTNIFGCYSYVSNGVVEPTLCVD